MNLAALFPLAQDQNKKAHDTLLACNSYTSPYGLSLSTEEVKELLHAQHQTLNELQRIEFGLGPLEQIIKVFCTSPHLEQNSYRDTLGALQEIFYRLKDVTTDELSDDDLVDALRFVFDNEAQGSLEFLTDLSPGALKKALNQLNQDIDEDWSEYDTLNRKEPSGENTSTPACDALTRIEDAETLTRPTNEYAAGFYDEYFELYRRSFDFNSRIGGSSL